MGKIQYPTVLDKIFDKLKKYSIKPVIVGGYVRDFILNIPSKDIDIELYHVEKLEDIVPIIEEFGKVNLVGKSFGVVKLTLECCEIDFSLPRTDTHTGNGHRDFSVQTFHTLSFKDAARRRDFTINAIGYDTVAQKLLDPYNGISDLRNKKLKAVDLETFVEDPLRVLRAVGFATRFELSIDAQLFSTCKHMVTEKNVLQDLPKERIFEELKKLLLKSNKPSNGFGFMQRLGMFSFFRELAQLNEKELHSLLTTLDTMKNIINKKNIEEKVALTALLTTLTSSFSLEDTYSFLSRLTENKILIKKILTLHRYRYYLDYQSAKDIDMELLGLFLEAFEVKNPQEILLHVKPRLHGKELIEQGIKPSKEFSVILQNAYQEQVRKAHPFFYVARKVFVRLS